MFCNKCGNKQEFANVVKDQPAVPTAVKQLNNQTLGKVDAEKKETEDPSAEKLIPNYTIFRMQRFLNQKLFYDLYILENRTDGVAITSLLNFILWGDLIGFTLWIGCTLLLILGESWGAFYGYFFFTFFCFVTGIVSFGARLFFDYRNFVRIQKEITRRNLKYKFCSSYFWLPFVNVAKKCKAMNLLIQDYNQSDRDQVIPDLLVNEEKVLEQGDAEKK